MALRRRGHEKVKRPSVIDVGRLAGVDHSTVSRVLNNSPNVSELTRSKVMAAVQMTGYKPFSSARSLVLRRHETIGLVFEREHVNTSYGVRLIEGITERLSEMGWRLAMGMVRWYSPADEIENLPLLRTQAVDGLILDVTLIRGNLDAVVGRLGLPYVYVNPSGGRAYNTIMPDDIGAVRMATQYLLDRGHRKIGYIPCCKRTHHSSQGERMKGYAQTLSQAGLAPIPTWDQPMDDIYRPEGGYYQRIKLYRERYGCTAVVTYSSLESVRVLFTCHQLGLKVPDDLAIVGCDFDPMATFAPVPMPTVRLDRIQMGQLAVEMLKKRIEHPEEDQPSVTIKGTMIENPWSWYGPDGLNVGEEDLYQEETITDDNEPA